MPASAHKKEKSKKHIQILLAIAKADGTISYEEIDYLEKIAKKSGLSQEELYEIVEDPSFSTEQPFLSFNEKIRFDMAFDMIWVMLIDGEMHPREILLCKKLGMKLGFYPSSMDNFISQIQSDIKKKIDSEVSRMAIQGNF